MVVYVILKIFRYYDYEVNINGTSLVKHFCLIYVRNASDTHCCTAQPRSRSVYVELCDYSVNNVYTFECMNAWYKPTIVHSIRLVLIEKHIVPSKQVIYFWISSCWLWKLHKHILPWKYHIKFDATNSNNNQRN